MDRKYAKNYLYANQYAENDAKTYLDAIKNAKIYPCANLYAKMQLTIRTSQVDQFHKLQRFLLVVAVVHFYPPTNQGGDLGNLLF